VAAENIADLIDSLTAPEQEAVREFIRFLKSGNKVPASPFLAAVEEFIAQHPDLLWQTASWLLPRLDLDEVRHRKRCLRARLSKYREISISFRAATVRERS